MVNWAESPQTRHSLFLNRTVLCCLLLAATPACASLTGRNAITSSEDTTYLPVTISGLPENLRDKAEAALTIRGSAPTSILESRRRATKAASTLEEYLASEGYFAATASPVLVDTLETRPRLDVDTGQRFKIASIKASPDAELSPAAQAAVDKAISTLNVGGWARSTPIEALEILLVRRLKESGYAFAESKGIDALASRADANVELVYLLSPGPLVHLGEMSLPEGLRTKPSATRLLRTWQPGDLYAPEKVENLRTRLRGTGLYDGIGVSIHETPEPNGTHTVDLQLSEGKRRSIGIGLSVSTADGTGADAFWERRNMTGRGDTLRVDAQAATLARHLTVSYERPNIGRFGRTLHTEIGIRGEETDAYDLQGLKVAADLSQPFNKNFTLSAGIAVDATRSTDLRLRTFGINELQDQVTLSFPLGATYNTISDPLDPQSGNRLYLGVEPGISFGGGNASYTRVQTSASTYRKVSDKLVAAVRAELGAFIGEDDVPVDRKFYAGGGGSVRGFTYQSLSPVDALGNPIGGDALFNMSTELRWRKSQRWGYVAFVDAGAASGSIDEAISDMRSSIGFGVRYYPGFGPIRLDIATPIDRRDGEDPVQVYVSIGQAF